MFLSEPWEASGKELLPTYGTRAKLSRPDASVPCHGRSRPRTAAQGPAWLGWTHYGPSGTRQKWKISEPAPQLLSQNLHFNQIPQVPLGETIVKEDFYGKRDFFPVAEGRNKQPFITYRIRDLNSQSVRDSEYTDFLPKPLKKFFCNLDGMLPKMVYMLPYFSIRGIMNIFSFLMIPSPNYGPLW